MAASGTHRRSPHCSRAFALALLGVLLVSGRPVWATFPYTVLSSSGSVRFLEATGLASSSSVPVFNPVAPGGDGALVDPGRSGFFRLGTVVGSSTPVSSSNITDPLFLDVTEAGIANFGAGRTKETAAIRTSVQGSTLGAAGVFYDPPTGVASPMGVVLPFASVSISQTTATLQYTGPSGVFVKPGMLLNLAGAVGSMGAGDGVLEAGLNGTISFSGNPTTFNFAPIVIAAVRTGAVSQTFISTPGGAGGFVGPIGNFRASGTTGAISLGSIMLVHDQTFTIHGTLTLVSDPGSTFFAGTDLPVFSPDLTVPDIGVYVGLPVPEPAAIVQLGTGLLVAGLWGLRLRRSSRDRSRVA